MNKRTDIHCSNEEEEELNMHLMKNLAFQKHLQESKLKMLQHYRNKDIYDSDSDSEEKIDINRDSFTEYKMNGFQISSSKYAKEQYSKSFSDTNQQEYSVPEIKEQSKGNTGRLQDAESQRISDDTLDAIHMENNAEITKQSSKEKKIWLEERQKILKNSEVDHFSAKIKKEDYSKEEEAKYSEDKTVYSNSPYDNHETLKQNNVHDEMKSLSSSERKDTEKSSQQTCEKESTTNHSNENNQSTHNLEKEYLKSRIGETLSTTQNSDKEILNKDNFNIEAKNKLNTSLEAEDVSTLSNNAPHQDEQGNGTKTEIINTKQSDGKRKVINYNKEKLLATMRAIDNNENIEFLNQGFRNHNMNRMQITENLYRGLPSHSKPKRDIIKDIFEDNRIENKVRGSCSKSH